MSSKRVKIFLKDGTPTEKVGKIATEISKLGIYIDNTLETIGLIVCKVSPEQVELLNNIAMIEKIEDEEG